VGSGSGPLGRVVRAVVAYDRLEVPELRRLGVPLDRLGQAYLAATAWARETMGAVGG
jgi:hypothetical protein